MSTLAAKPRWYQLTPDRLVLALLAAEGLLLLSEQFRWFGFNAHKGYAVLIAVAGVGATMLVMLAWLIAGLLIGVRFQFSLRSLCLLVVAVAVPCSWLKVEMQRAERQRQAVVRIREFGGYVESDCGMDLSGWPVARITPLVPIWLRRLLGYEFFATAVFARCPNGADAELKHVGELTQLKHLFLASSQANDAGLEHIRELTQLETLFLDLTRVTDAGLQHLSGMTHLKELWLDGTEITDAGLEELRGMTQLEMLWLDGTQVGDAGLERLEGLSHLRWLSLGDRITDAGLERLARFRHLRTLHIDSTEVSDEGIRTLQQALPDCEIFRHWRMRTTTAVQSE